MAKKIINLILLSLLVPFNGAIAQPRSACLTVPKANSTQSCFQNEGVPPMKFEAFCNKLGSSGSVVKVVYMPSCPAGATLSCPNIMGAPITNYFYGLELPPSVTAESICETLNMKPGMPGMPGR